jgi:beta-ribofuranosylaminobenzene 5'-phosphate synthase
MEVLTAQSKGARKAHFSARAARVTTTARLHFGFLDPSGRGKRPFGSFGLSLDRPKTSLMLAPAQALEASGPESERALRYLQTLAQSCGGKSAYKLEIEEAIPSHAGLGSGTQLALAVGAAFAALEGLPLDPAQIAARLGRGARSGIGIATFQQGGAVLDSGPRDGRLPELVRRVEFPARWRVLLIFDPETRGFAGLEESSAFAALPSFPEAETEELRRRVTQGALKALAAENFEKFCEQIGHLQARMGRYFGPVQGGAFTSARVSEAIDWLRRRGLTGVGQSSWGPTGFAFVPSEARGEALLAELRGLGGQGLAFDLAKGRNKGAKIETSAGEIR